LDIWHGLKQSAVDSAINGELVFSPAYGSKEDILSSDNMLIESLKEWSNVSKSWNVFFQSVNNTKSYHKSFTQLCHQELVEQIQLFYTFMFHTVVQWGL